MYIYIYIYIYKMDEQSYIRKPEAVAQMCSVKKVLVEISQKTLENTCVKVSFLIKLQAGL